MRIDNIHGVLEKITKYVKDLRRDTWKNDEKPIDAVIQNLEISHFRNEGNKSGP